MDCTLIQLDLIAYHFATASEEERERVETHLVACTSCLRTYLALKAHVDGMAGTVGAARQDSAQGTSPWVQGPSEGARLKLRAAVERRFRPTRVGRLRRWLTQPIPLYRGVAVAGVLLVTVALGPSLAHRLEHRPLGSSAEVPVEAQRVDTSRTRAESLTIY
jgi:hypothetical protein